MGNLWGAINTAVGGGGGRSSSVRSRYTQDSTSSASSGKRRSSSVGRDRRHQRSRLNTEIRVAPLNEAVEVVQTSPDRLIGANIPFLADKIIEASENAGWPAELALSVACKLLRKHEIPVSIGQLQRGRQPGESAALSAILHTVQFWANSFQKNPNWRNTVTPESCPILKAGYLLYTGRGGRLAWDALVGGLARNLKAALSLSHSGQRQTACKVVIVCLEAAQEEHGAGGGDSRNLLSGRVLRTTRRVLRTCTDDAKRRLAAKALKRIISPAKHMGTDGEPVDWHEVFGCHPNMYFDQVINPLCHEILSKAASFLAGRVEEARLEAGDDDHESEDDQTLDGGVNAVEELLGFVKAFAKVPAGGAGAAHHELLARCRARKHAFAINARGPVPPAAALRTTEDAQRYLLPYLSQEEKDAGSDNGDSDNGGSDGGGSEDDDTDLDGGAGAGAPSGDSSGDSSEDDGSLFSDDA